MSLVVGKMPETDSNNKDNKDDWSAGLSLSLADERDPNEPAPVSGYNEPDSDDDDIIQPPTSPKHESSSPVAAAQSRQYESMDEPASMSSPDTHSIGSSGVTPGEGEESENDLFTGESPAKIPTKAEPKSLDFMDLIAPSDGKCTIM